MKRYIHATTKEITVEDNIDYDLFEPSNREDLEYSVELFDQKMRKGLEDFRLPELYNFIHCEVNVRNHPMTTEKVIISYDICVDGLDKYPACHREVHCRRSEYSGLFQLPVHSMLHEMDTYGEVLPKWLEDIAKQLRKKGLIKGRRRRVQGGKQ